MDGGQGAAKQDKSGNGGSLTPPDMPRGALGEGAGGQAEARFSEP